MTPTNGTHYSSVSTRRFGATLAEWKQFADVLGLTEDLLPVVSNPGVPLSPLSKMNETGKTPSMLNRLGQAAGIKDWPQKYSNRREVSHWSSIPDLGACIQTRRARALDIDITNEDKVREVIEAVEMLVGPLPRRYRENSAKCLLVFWLPDGQWTKRIMRTEWGNIEFLATGQQFIAAGTHPSGVRYEWEGGLPAEIPPLTGEDFEGLWAGLAVLLGAQVTTLRGPGKAAGRRDASDVNDPLVAVLWDRGYVRSMGSAGELNIICPFEHEHTTPDNETATRYYPAGLGGYQQGHFKCLHAHCADRPDQRFLDAMGFGVINDFDPVVDPAGDAPVDSAGGVLSPGGDTGWPPPGPLPALARTARGANRGAILATPTNAMALIVRPDLMRMRIGYDRFLDVIGIEREGEREWRAICDEDYLEVSRAFESLGVVFGREMVRDVVRWAAKRNAFDSAIRWGQSLTWDGVPRVEGFFARYLLTEDTPYTRAVGLYLWTALAGRCMDPGCKADMAVVLVSRQGTGKTTTVEALAPRPELFVEMTLEHRDNDLSRSSRGKLVGELSELRGLAGREAEGIRAWMSRRTEEWTPKYREYATRYERRFIPIGTTNSDEFLADPEGERRWLPVRVGVSDIDALRADVEQLWAEGIVLWRAGGVLWRRAEELAPAVHADHKVRDPWQPIIADWLERGGIDDDDDRSPRKMRPVIVTDVLLSGLGLGPRDISRVAEMRAAVVLRALGYTKRDTWDAAAHRSRKAWVSPDLREARGWE